MLGFINSNYNSLGNSLINPSLLTNSKNYLEVNVLTFNYFIFNDFAYLPAEDYSIWNAIAGNDLPTYGEKNSNFLYYRNRNPKNAFSNLRFLGPSAAYHYGKHGFALTTGVRYLVSTNNVPWEMPVMGYEGLNYEPIQNVNFNNYNIDVSTQGWMEIGLSYAYDVYRFLDEQITVAHH